MSQQHAALMDQVYGRTRHIYDISRKFFLFGRDTLIRQLDAQPGQVVCELGCGTARNLMLMAKRYPDARFCGLDASEAMLTTAKAKLKGEGGHIRLAHGYAEQFQPQDLFGPDMARPDHYVFSYSLSMIPPWEQALQHCWDLLPTGGALHMVDFGALDAWPRPIAMPFLAFLRAFHVTPKAAIHAWGNTLLQQGQAKVLQRSILGGYAIYTRIEKREL